MASSQEPTGTSDVRTETVHTCVVSTWPKDYHCACAYCRRRIGLLVRPDGTKYSRLDRRKYYDAKAERVHFAKTPLHVARWAVQRYSAPDDWVLDPTAGAGTTLVEALNHGRNAVGCEIQFVEAAVANIDRNNPQDKKWQMWHMDARDLGEKLGKLGVRFSLVVNNPPYSGDKQSQRGYRDVRPEYDEAYDNLALMGESAAYWEVLQGIYASCVEHLKVGGHLVTGVKDMVRDKRPRALHKELCAVVHTIPSLEFVGTALLPHHPTTQFMNTYPKRFPDVKIPRYQTINVWRKRI